MHRTLLRLALTGSLAGCMVALTGCGWALWLHEEDELAFCDDNYDACMATAWTEEDEQWCIAEVELCYEACEAGWEDDDPIADEADDQGEGDQGEGESSSSSGPTDEGEADTTDGADTDEIPQACFDLHANCIAQAESLADVEACEALFEQCANPGECPMCGCPEEALDACLSDYADCTDAASSEPEIDECAAQFDACTEPFADLCELGENPNLEACLAQHELCVACADGDEQIAACKAVFDSCMIQQ
jgi:hypothetical protein